MGQDGLQTMARTFQQIHEGHREWTALGNFMNHWYDYSKDRREELIADPLPAYDPYNEHDQKWATFCAASVVYFCETYEVVCPEWVHDYEPLAEPWFHGIGSEKPGVRQRLRIESPEVFRRYHIFCSPQVYANKWELYEKLSKVNR